MSEGSKTRQGPPGGREEAAASPGELPPVEVDLGDWGHEPPVAAGGEVKDNALQSGPSCEEIVAELRERVGQALRARGGERRALAGEVRKLLGVLARRGGSREVADAFHLVLEDRRLGGLEDEAGRSVRAAAVEGLLRLGFPYALEVSPEDLAVLRAERHWRWRPWVGLGLVGAGLTVQGLVEPEALSQWTELLARGEMGLAGAGVLATLPRAGGWLKWVGRGALGAAAGLGAYLAWGLDLPGAWAGVSAIVGCLVFVRPRQWATREDVRGVD